ncbi:MAG: hypothetical protein M1834_000027 [Cirrosporium novae-zelandiae]|nr:MAG: hypothetical protein M1834_000027 [Cirrosporium novae-zelandiae]
MASNNEAVNENATERPSPALGEEDNALGFLDADIKDQDDLERDISRQASPLLEILKLSAHIQRLRQRLNQHPGAASSLRIQAEISSTEDKIKSLDTDLAQIQERIDIRHKDVNGNGEGNQKENGTRRLPNESQREFLIRTGKITPFSKMADRGGAGPAANLEEVLLDAEEEDPDEEEYQPEYSTQAPKSHRHLLLPGFTEDQWSETDSGVADLRPSKRRKFQDGTQDAESLIGEDSDEYIPDKHSGASDISEVEELDNERDDEFMPTSLPRSRKRKSAPKPKPADGKIEDFVDVDDGNEQLYQTRLQNWVSRRRRARQKNLKRQEQNNISIDPEAIPSSPAQPQIAEGDDGQASTEPEWYLPHPIEGDTEFEGGYKIPGDIYPLLFDYQKTGVQWLWELYSQQVGGIVGDEMGLGKTIQTISFLAGLHYSKLLTKPIIVVCPATVMKQWVNEFHRWWPPLRVSILHSSGSGMVDIGREQQREESLISERWKSSRSQKLPRGHKAAKKIVDRVVKEGHVLVTTYTGLQTYAKLLIPTNWEYAVLDEGHKIRNPNTAITIYCKELLTANRVILSGTPMQNNLAELWSLFDFVFPMRLGTLVNFRNQFEIPIKQGGYANASNLQVQTAMKCATTLKDAISPYLLQRYKVDVASDLPKKTEQLVFCKLTKLQRDAYETFLASGDMKSIMNGKRQVLFGIDILRKICNHPDLEDHKNLALKPGYEYGSPAKSGKMKVVKGLLDDFKNKGHKTLLFAQHRIMLDILENYIKSLGGFNYCRMDGTTPIAHRQTMVDKFNNTPDLHVFLLTTKVGGLGINLTGANRVLIYDPDWNPSTDVQARERAWRLGQTREVKIFRLLTAGTIEEKIFHRQVYKQFLTNKVLKDPTQRQTFQMKNLHDLFTLGSEDEKHTETSELFKGNEVRFDTSASGKAREDAVNRITPCTQEGEETTSNKDSSNIRDVAGVHAVEHFNDQKGSGDRNSDDRVMEGIFSRSGVQSVLEHDQIINGKKVIAADPKMVEKEAKRVAAEAARGLRKAGEIAKRVPIGTVTWTGEFGTGGRPEGPSSQGGFLRNTARGGPASSSILASLQSRRVGNNAANSGRVGQSGESSRSGTPASRGLDFIKMIRDYIQVQGGYVYTQMLIDHFNRYCKTDRQSQEFGAMLREIAVLEKGSRGRGRWVLKEEYRNTRS